jgi:hypothetical protein
MLRLRVWAFYTLFCGGSCFGLFIHCFARLDNNIEKLGCHRAIQLFARTTNYQPYLTSQLNSERTKVSFSLLMCDSPKTVAVLSGLVPCELAMVCQT